MSLTSKQLLAALNLRSVSRASLHWTHKTQQVDQHCYRAAALYDYLGGTELRAMLFHDNEEIATGDIPSPAKIHISGLESFESLKPKFKSARQKKLGKLCDLLELVLDLLEYADSTKKLPGRMATTALESVLKISYLSNQLGNTKEVNKLLAELGHSNLTGLVTIRRID